VEAYLVPGLPVGAYRVEASASGFQTVTYFGDLSRNAVTGPNFINADFSIIKTTKLNETMSLQFRTEAFGILNHPNFGNPGRVVGTPSFGVVSNTRVPTGDFGSSRQIQFGLKFLF
jgi:hypothetical protein